MSQRTAVKSLFKGVRSSKYRHVFGSVVKKDRCYDNLKITKNANDSNFCAVNPKFIAICTESSGGGCFLVIPENNYGRVEVNAGRVVGHRGPILDLKWNPFNDNVIASCSDDCTIKIWYIPDEGLQHRNLFEPIMDLREHNRRVTFVEWHPTAENILVSTGFDFLLIVWNVAKGEAVCIIDCHPDAIHSMSFNRDGSLLATTCKDKVVRVIDPRNGTVVNSGLCHHGAKAARVVFLGDSGRLFTTGFSRYSDRQWAVWSAYDLSEPLTIENIDSSSGVLFPFYDYDTNMVYVAGKGDGNIRYYEITDEAPYCHYINQFLTGFPQRGLGVMPKRGLDIYRCEVFRFYKLHATRPVCEPISMIVPRKSQQFQSDIFPDTTAPTPALSAEEWLSGKNRNPILINLKTGVGAKTNKPVVLKTEKNILQTSDMNNERKFMFIAQENKVDYREKNGSTNGFHNIVNETKIIDKCVDAPTPPRKRLPWVKDMEPRKTTINLCDIVTVQQLPTATFVTLDDSHSESNPTPSPPPMTGLEITNTVDTEDIDQLINDINTSISNINNNNQNNSTFIHGVTNGHSNCITNGINYEKESSDDLSCSPPKNEIELWRAYHCQCTTIHTLELQIEAKDKRIKELEELVLRMGCDNHHIY
ncbi:coronin-2B-like isoform X2 [Oppia nitens]|uniref:coronin-2B-like isoform X2 n=1 Tax=Oppia nitens TaxID=1686743 RepID=UPI0023DC3E7C|nr:coronin-2B-like isoform X2 [Oppia nitens]